MSAADASRSWPECWVRLSDSLDSVLQELRPTMALNLLMASFVSTGLWGRVGVGRNEGPCSEARWGYWRTHLVYQADGVELGRAIGDRTEARVILEVLDNTA